MLLKYLLMSSLILIITSSTLKAAELEKISLREAVTRAMDQNNHARAARFQAEAARAGAAGASLHYLPSISLEESWSRSNLPVNTFMMKLNQGRFSNQDFDAAKLNNPSPTTDFKTAATIEQPIFLPVAWAAKKVAETAADGQEAMSEQVRLQIAFQVFQLYLEVQKAKAYLEAIDKSVDEARESRRQSAVRIAAGLGLKSDELRASTHLAAMEQKKISAINNLTLARMQLAIITGGNPGNEMDAVEPVNIKPPDKDMNAMLILAFNERKDLYVAERAREQADAAVLQARAGFLPTAAAFGSWQMNDHNTVFGREHDSWMVGVSLRWNIFDGFRSWNNDKQARSMRTAVNEQFEQTRKQVSYQVQEAWLRRTEALKLEEVSKKALISAEEAVRLLGKRFDNALATMLELLDAQSALNQARANHLESEANLQLATARLYHAAGVLLKEVQ